MKVDERVIVNVQQRSLGCLRCQDVWDRNILGVPRCPEIQTSWTPSGSRFERTLHWQLTGSLKQVLSFAFACCFCFYMLGTLFLLLFAILVRIGRLRLEPTQSDD